jgi:hypothetical protein
LERLRVISHYALFGLSLVFSCFHVYQLFTIQGKIFHIFTQTLQLTKTQKHKNTKLRPKILKTLIKVKLFIFVMVGIVIQIMWCQILKLIEFVILFAELRQSFNAIYSLRVDYPFGLITAKVIKYIAWSR